MTRLVSRKVLMSREHELAPYHSEVKTIEVYFLVSFVIQRNPSYVISPLQNNKYFAMSKCLQQ